jgi:hypothetical protein
MSCSFSGVGFAKTDDPNTSQRLAKYQHVQPMIQIPYGDNTDFGIVIAPVLVQLRRLKIEFRRPFGRQSAFTKVPFVLVRVEADFQDDYCTPNASNGEISNRKARRLGKRSEPRRNSAKRP